MEGAKLTSPLFVTGTALRHRIDILWIIIVVLLLPGQCVVVRLQKSISGPSDRSITCVGSQQRVYA